MKCRFAIVAVVIAMLSFAGVRSASADAINPWAFNVYSLGDIGTTGSGYGSDFQGAAGAAGSAYFSGFSLNDLNHDVIDGYSLHTGGEVRISGSINNGGIDAGGNVAINNASVFGNVSAGGNLTGAGGTIHGNATLGGQKLVGPVVTVTGATSQFQPYTPLVDHGAISSTFATFSTAVGAMSATTAASNVFGQLQINAVSGINVVSLTSAQLDAAWGVLINGPSDAVVYLNVTDAAASFDSLVWSYAGGATSANALLNLAFADTLALSGGDHIINLLAPFADVTFSSGLLTGNLIAGNLYGGGQVNHGSFNGPHIVIPEPATGALVMLGAAAAMLRRRRKPLAA